MDRDEILRLKQITGLTALFRDKEFGRAWIPEENGGESVRKKKPVQEEPELVSDLEGKPV